MVPSPRRLLEAMLVELTDEQIESMKVATYLGWTEVSLTEYEDRANRIAEIHFRLQRPEAG